MGTRSRWVSNGVALEPQKLLLSDLLVVATSTLGHFTMAAYKVCDFADDLARANANYWRDRAEFRADVQASIDQL